VCSTEVYKSSERSDDVTVREGEAPAEPLRPDSVIPGRGSARASPSRRNRTRLFRPDRELAVTPSFHELFEMIQKPLGVSGFLSHELGVDLAQDLERIATLLVSLLGTVLNGRCE